MDELIDLQNEIAECIDQSELSDELANRLQHHAGQLVHGACHFAGQVSGGDARAIAFRHPDPTSREAFSRFLNTVAEYAAPYVYATLKLGIETFTRTDVVAVIESLRSLDHGDVPTIFEPAEKERPRSAKYNLLREHWRAVRWVLYLEGRGSKEAAINEVAKAYEVSEKTVYNWHRTTLAIASGTKRKRELESIELQWKEHGYPRPEFTLAPYLPGDDEQYKGWLNYDAMHYKTLSKTTS